MSALPQSPTCDHQLEAHYKYKCADPLAPFTDIIVVECPTCGSKCMLAAPSEGESALRKEGA